MRVLHLFSNSKWTGPAEPVLRLCLSLRKLGVEVDFACAPGPDVSINKIVTTARSNDLEPILRFRLSKHRDPLRNWRDGRLLARFLRVRSYDIVHCHLDNAHRIAVHALRHHAMPLVRSNYEGEGGFGGGIRRLLGKTAYLIEPSVRAMMYDIQKGGIDPACVAVVPGTVDIARFDPAREVPDGRERLGIPADAFVVGIVARIQPYRHYDDFLEAIRRLVGIDNRVHAIVVGRGSKQERVAHEPVRRLGLEEHVHFAGFLEGDAYVGMVKAFDVKVFMQPGTDGTCRAVREAMALGKPAVVADRGMLSEIVDHGDNGLVFDGHVEMLFEALRRLLLDRSMVYAFGQAARKKALGCWTFESQAKAVAAIYEKVLTLR